MRHRWTVFDDCQHCGLQRRRFRRFSHGGLLLLWSDYEFFVEGTWVKCKTPKCNGAREVKPVADFKRSYRRPTYIRTGRNHTYDNNVCIRCSLHRTEAAVAGGYTFKYPYSDVVYSKSDRPFCIVVDKR